MTTDTLTTYELCREYLKPLLEWLDDPTVSSIMVNGPNVVYVERNGKSMRVECRIDEGDLRMAAQQIAVMVNDAEISDEKPILDARLHDRSRLAVVLSPVSVDGTVMTIRKHRLQHFSLTQLIEMGSISGDVATLLSRAVRERESILIAGGGGTGKTTLLNALANTIPPEERVCVIEDTSELQLSERNLIRFEGRKAQDGLPAITSRDLVKTALRHQPDRIIVGEVRGEEAFDFLQAMNTGHDGTIGTIHASSAEEALTRLASLVLLAGVPLREEALQAQIASGLDYVVQLQRDTATGKRSVREVIQVGAFKQGEIATRRIWPV